MLAERHAEEELELPVLPSTLAGALSLRGDDPDCFDKLLDLAKGDPIYAARLVRLANSAQYFRRTGARSASQALTTVGARAARDLLVGHALCQVFLPRRAEERRLWLHALQVAVASRELASATGMADPEEAHFVGLVHDLGRFRFFHARPEKAARCASHLEDLDAEHLAFGLDHAQAGAELAQAWQMPESVVEVLLHHHDEPGSGPSPLTELVRQADRISQALLGEGKDPYAEAVQALAGLSDLPEGELLALAERSELESASLAHALRLG